MQRTELLLRLDNEGFAERYMSTIRPGIYELAGGGSVQYLSVTPGDFPELQVGLWRSSEEFGLGPGQALNLGDGAYSRIRYDGDDHLNDELILMLNNLRAKIANNEHIKIE